MPKFFHLLIACVALVGTSAMAQDYPNKAITVVIPNAPGGSSDPIARIVGAALTEAWGQQVLLDHRSGANGNIGYQAARARKPDGYTLFLGNDSQMVTS
ncbi:MAG: tripartite tricarboxylate transporter substrate-binding protein, partial [Vicinamibacterales bacterium]